MYTLRNSLSNELVNNCVQAFDPQSGRDVTRNSTRISGIVNCGTWGTREKNRGRLFRDSASAATFITPGMCTHV